LSEVPRQKCDATIPENPPRDHQQPARARCDRHTDKLPQGENRQAHRNANKNPAGAGLSANPDGASRAVMSRSQTKSIVENPGNRSSFTRLRGTFRFAQSLSHCRNAA
jgi:hypothetical protein